MNRQRWIGVLIVGLVLMVGSFIGPAQPVSAGSGQTVTAPASWSIMGGGSVAAVLIEPAQRIVIQKAQGPDGVVCFARLEGEGRICKTVQQWIDLAEPKTSGNYLIYGGALTTKEDLNGKPDNQE